MEFLEKTSWLLSNITNGICPIVSIFFWAAILPWTEMSLTLENIFYHSFNSVCVLLDLLLSARPVKVAHVIYPTLTGLSYILFTLIYWSLGGTTEHGNPGIYSPALDWDKPVISIIWASIAVKG